jgi:hypothetical protein
MTEFAVLSVAGTGDGERRVAPVRRHLQPALAAGFYDVEVIQMPPITAAGAGCSNGMSGICPSNEQGLMPY